MNQAHLLWQERRSPSSFIESVWLSSALKSTARAVIADPCTSIALVKSGDYGETVMVMGPKTKPRQQLLSAGHTCMTIRLTPGVFLNNFQTYKFTDTSVALPTDDKARFRLGKDRFEFPGFDHAERLIEDLFTRGHLGFESPQNVYKQSHRTYARQIKRITGLSPYKLYQLQRMHQALRLLQQGVTAADVAIELAFTDQAHFIHASKRFFGYTPGRLNQLLQSP
ncbi:MAG TPA: helix-turn-helix domain-containing protein [Candidatus Saccharimonadales bacterium]